MAVVSTFYELIISICCFEERRQKVPYVHAKYKGFDAEFSIPKGDIIEGYMPNSKVKLVQAWIEIHKEDLMVDWDRVSSGKFVHRIDPLK